MAKSLRYKIANIALCCTVVTGALSQGVTILATPEMKVMAQDDEINKEDSKEGNNESEKGEEDSSETDNELEQEEDKSEEDNELEQEEEKSEGDNELEQEEEKSEEDNELEQEEEIPNEEDTKQEDEVTEDEVQEEVDQEMPDKLPEGMNTEEKIQEIVMAAESLYNPWEEAVNAAEHLVSIRVLRADKDQNSIAATFFERENVPVVIREGKAYLTIKINKDVMGAVDAIQSLKIEKEGTFIDLEIQHLENEDVRYIMAEIDLESIEEAAMLKVTINLPSKDGNPIVMKQSLRVKLTDDSIVYLKDKMPEQVAIDVTTTPETAVGKKDGSIHVVATGGTGEFEYTIDGGQTWATTDLFENLEPGNYEVGARDAKQTHNKADLKKVEILAATNIGNVSVADGIYNVTIHVLDNGFNEAADIEGLFAKENVVLQVKEGKAHLTLTIYKDGVEQADTSYALAYKVGEGYESLVLEHLEDEMGRYMRTQLPLEQINEAVSIKYYDNTSEKELRVKLTDESIAELSKGEQTQVQITVDKTDVTAASKGSLVITAVGGEGVYEYTIDGGQTWGDSPNFMDLEVGVYTVAARGVTDTNNISSFQIVEIEAKDLAIGGNNLLDGYYSVDIEVLKEDANESSIASQFFNKEALPLQIIDGRAYLTIQVVKDGMGMKDVITSLEQRINGSYTNLYLEHLNDSSKRYVTTEVVFESIMDEAYIRCDIAPMAGFNPTLRIKLDASSIKEGMGSINTNLGKVEGIAIETVTAENGKVKIKLSNSDETLTASDFAAKLYLDNSTSGEALKLENFKMEADIVTFTYEPIQVKEKEQTAVVGIFFKELETKSNSFKISNLVKQPIAQIQIKENAKEIKYIKGYEDGTFRPYQKVSKAEALSMLALLIDAPVKTYQTATIDVLQISKDEKSVAKQFFKTEDIRIESHGDNYKVYLEIANEGMGFNDIITSVQHKIDNEYKALDVIKSKDLKTAYVTIEVSDLKEAIILKTGIAPMGNVTPELRVVIDKDSLKESAYASQYEDIDMWAKEEITLFESLEIIGEDKANHFYPNEEITRGEFIAIVGKIAQLSDDEGVEIFDDIVGHTHEFYIKAANKAGFINGYIDGTFKPDNTLTRAEAVAIINQLIGHDETTDIESINVFTDLKESYWAYNDIMKVVDGE